MPASKKDFYKILGVPDKASQAEIKKAYRRLAKKYHPDANQGDEKASDRFKEVGEAYSVVSNPEKRKKYDQLRRFGGLGFGGGGGRPGPSGAGGHAPGGFSFDDIGGFGDIFSSIFDRGRGDPAKPARGGISRGEDVEYVVEIPFKTAVRGGRISISVPITEECATCTGSGAAPGTGTKRCAECKGSGTVTFGQGGFAVSRPCPACLGRGKLPEKPCAACGGHGEIRQTRKVQVAVPSGVDTGSKIRLPGKGERGARGGKPGDLIITCKVKPHSFFRRDGLDIHVSVPINVAQAMLGSKMSVKTVDGKKVLLKIPAGTQTGTRFRIRGQGVKKGTRTGDQLVEVTLSVPEELSEEERTALEAFATKADLRH